MKKILALLTGVALATACASAFAKKASCPDVYNLREEGSTLTRAFQEKGKVWIASSTPYLFDDSVWQTHFIEAIPGVNDPATALAIAQVDFNNYSMMTKPKEYNADDTLICDYSPEGVNYHILAVNAVDVGFKKFI